MAFTSPETTPLPYSDASRHLIELSWKSSYNVLSQRVGRCLERQGLLMRDADDCMDAGGRAKQDPEPNPIT